MQGPRKPIRPDRVRKIPSNFSWIDREILHRGLLARLSQEEILLYFFLVLVAGPDGTSFWSYQRMGKHLKLTPDEVCAAARSLIKRDLVAFEYPTFQVLAIPEDPERGEP